MPIVFAGVCPHTPLLIPNIGKQATEKLEKTITALKKMEENLYIHKPDIIIVITPHGQVYDRAFNLYAYTDLHSNYEDFGDFTIKESWKGAPNLAALISTEAYKKNCITHLTTERKLDYGTTIPLHFLTPHLKNIKVLPIGYSEMSTKDHLGFGSVIKNVCMLSQERIALVASANLSHTLTSDSPAGYHKDGKEFDEKMIQLLQSHNTAGIMHMNPDLVKNAKEYGYKTIVMLLGSIQHMNYTFKNYAYESPFGVGYLTGEFEFS